MASLRAVLVILGALPASAKTLERDGATFAPLSRTLHSSDGVRIPAHSELTRAEGQAVRRAVPLFGDADNRVPFADDEPLLDERMAAMVDPIVVVLRELGLDDWMGEDPTLKVGIGEDTLWHSGTELAKALAEWIKAARGRSQGEQTVLSKSMTMIPADFVWPVDAPVLDNVISHGSRDTVEFLAPALAGWVLDMLPLSFPDEVLEETCAIYAEVFLEAVVAVCEQRAGVVGGVKVDPRGEVSSLANFVNRVMEVVNFVHHRSGRALFPMVDPILDVYEQLVADTGGEEYIRTGSEEVTNALAKILEVSRDMSQGEQTKLRKSMTHMPSELLSSGSSETAWFLASALACLPLYFDYLLAEGAVADYAERFLRAIVAVCKKIEKNRGNSALTKIWKPDGFPHLAYFVYHVMAVFLDRTDTMQNVIAHGRPLLLGSGKPEFLIDDVMKALDDTDPFDDYYETY